MKDHVSDFERGQKIVKILIALAIGLCVAALMFSRENSTQQTWLIAGAATCLVGVVVVALRFCRCPHCGKRIINGVLVLKVCPKCKRSLITGKKVK